MSLMLAASSASRWRAAATSPFWCCQKRSGTENERVLVKEDGTPSTALCCQREADVRSPELASRARRDPRCPRPGRRGCRAPGATRRRDPRGFRAARRESGTLEAVVGSTEAPPRRPRRRFSEARAVATGPLVRDEAVVRLRDVDLRLHDVGLRDGPAWNRACVFCEKVGRVLPALEQVLVVPERHEQACKPARPTRRPAVALGQAELGRLDRRSGHGPALDRACPETGWSRRCSGRCRCPSSGLKTMAAAP